MREKRWIIGSYDREEAAQIARASGLSPLLCAVLSSRGVHTGREAARFLETSVDKLGSPYELKGMQQAVDTIRDAAAKGEKIAVYGDYDVDGVTATTILVRYLREIGADCTYYIPDRLTEGYGMNREALDRLYEQGVRLLISVDTGITAVEEISYIRERGMRVVVTDHHECKEELPEAEAVVNPKQPDCPYPFKELAGVGVAFKLLCALLGDPHEALNRAAELVALGTVADVMPLRDENRAIVNYGLRRLDVTANVGLRVLCREAGLIGEDKKPVAAQSLSFVLAPRINAAGRFGMAERAVELFLTEDPDEALAIVRQLAEKNKERQGTESNIMKEALDQFEQDCDPSSDRAIVLWNKGWHHGIIGIVASKLVDRFSRPVILLSVDETGAKGSGRSIRGFNLFEALQNLPVQPRQFGGHELAAGLTVEVDDLERFREAMRSYAAAHLKEEDCVPCLEVDCEIEPELLTLHDVESLRMLEPCGMGNRSPLFVLRDMVLVGVASIGNDRHTRLTAEGRGCSLGGVFFGQNAAAMGLDAGDGVDIVFSAEVNSFRGRQVQMIVRDIRLSRREKELDRVSRALYDRFCAGEHLAETEKRELATDRAQLVAVWRYLVNHCTDGILDCAPETLYRRIRHEAGCGMNLGKLLTALSVFEELRLIESEKTAESLRLHIHVGAPKVDLASSKVLRRLA